MSGPYRVGILGATGAVGSTLLEVLGERDFPVAELVPLASQRSAGKRVGFRWRRGRGPGARSRARSKGSTWCSPRRAAPSPPSGRLGSSRPAPSWSTTPPSSACTTTCRWSSPRSTPMPPATTAACREPELHDDADGRRARADPARGGNRAPRRLHLPVRLGHRAQRDRGAAIAVARRSSTAKTASAEVFPHQVAFNVLPQVETFDDGDDYTTEERKVMRRDAQDLRRLRGGAADLGNLRSASP